MLLVKKKKLSAEVKTKELRNKVTLKHHCKDHLKGDSLRGNQGTERVNM